MRLLVTGRGGAGSWTVRGEQIGAALGAHVKAKATLADMRAADVILAVKRVPQEMLDDLRKAARPWAYDIVDAYPQPVCSSWSKHYAIDWLRQHVSRMQPDLVIWPNARMQADFGAGAGAVIHHHCRPGIARNPIRPRIEAVGYEGSERYLDGWRATVEAECLRRGARVVVNPARLADVDVVLALRGGAYNGYPQRHWKSNVKLANAHGSGTPFIGTPECGYQETAVGCERWAETPAQLAMALDWLESQASRQAVGEQFAKAAFHVEQAAQLYREALCALKF